VRDSAGKKRNVVTSITQSVEERREASV
jgi:hypothetical protein